MTATHPNGTRQGGRLVTLAEPATPRGADEFRIAAGLAAWSPAVLRRSLLHEETRQRAAGRWRDAMTAHRGWLAAIPVVLVNAVAFGAQLSFWRAHLALALEAVAVALATESIANYLAWQAHLAQLADDAALRLRMAAYGTALVIGTLNYSHYMLPHWHPTVAAVTFGMMSAISPWLWSVHSRRVSRDALKSRGLIEPHAVRLGANRWLWHPLRSAQVMFRATWEGETDPARAIALIAKPATPAAAEDSTDDAPDDADERQDDDGTSDTDDDEPDRDERQDDDADRDKPDPPDRRRQRHGAPSASDTVLAVIRRSKKLREQLASDKAADRKAAKEQVAERAGVTVRTVERALADAAGAQ